MSYQIFVCFVQIAMQERQHTEEKTKESNGASGGTRTRTSIKTQDFLTTIVFTTFAVCGLDFTFIIAHSIRCLPSSLYTFKDISILASLGISI